MNIVGNRGLHPVVIIQKTVVTAAIALFLCLGPQVGMANTISEEQQPFPAAAAVHNAETLRIISLNLAHGRNKSLNQLLVSTKRTRKNIRAIGEMLKREKIDVVALQEADGPSRWSGNFDHVAQLSSEAFYPAHAHSRHAQNWIYNYGTALISKISFREVLHHTFKSTPPTTNKGFTLGQIAWQPGASEEGSQLIDIVSVHLDFSRRAVREQQIAEMVSVLSQRAYPLIIMGDFNSDWLADDQVIHELANKVQLHAYLPLTPDMATYPRSGKRLDWILISDKLEFIDYQTLPDILSDHLAVKAVIRLKQS